MRAAHAVRLDLGNRTLHGHIGRAARVLSVGLNFSRLYDLVDLTQWNLLEMGLWFWHDIHFQSTPTVADPLLYG